MERSLDPADWDELRALGHRMLDDMIDDLASIREAPVWRNMPSALRAELRSPLPRAGQPLDAVYEEFGRLVAPYATGNRHPRFMGWVHGGGTPVGMLAEMLAAGLNANLGGRDHAPIEVERQVVRWAAEMLGLPESTSGLMVTGTSIANMIAVLVARAFVLGPGVRSAGVGEMRLVAYTSAAAHGCIARAMDMCGLGTDALRLVPVDAAHRMDSAALADMVARDRADGASPFLVVGTAGTVDVGAVDDLAGLAAFCRRERLWFHVDGAFGAMAALSPRLRALLAGIQHAHSVAFDFHKWAQVPYDAGCILVRDPAAQIAAFAQHAAYLRREERGLAGGHPWPCDLGPDLSRGFRALKVWMTLKAYGADRLGAVVEQTCELAQRLAAMVDAEPALERLAPVALNIVCFRVRAGAADLDRLNAEIVADLQVAGIAAPSTTTVDGKLAIRAAIVNHRTTEADLRVLVNAVVAATATRAVTAVLSVAG
ncbi:MAG TPA: pyridoxal-dependent decarboxylase [Acetobacteraceae bacterium]|jgi:glutamate/tyrosine decarboxylase-like PLP-dependent enzyme|nr:pyridoxal-dependent decarboxylase [Acetobacteraceae bacterium]